MKDKLKSGEMMVAGDQWPIFIYEGYSYDPEDPWTGLLRSSLLVTVHILTMYPSSQLSFHQAFKHIFTSPSSVHKESSATRPGNARLHGMTCVTSASIAYVATQACNFISVWLFIFSLMYTKVCFALSSAPVFSRTDTTTDSECFYNSIFYLLHDAEEQVEVNLLLSWWNR
jgi:hypothetical protein